MTRALDAAIKAGCEHNRPPEMVCGFPDCVNHMVLRCKYVEQVTLAALHAALPAEPAPEVIEGMARQMCVLDGDDPDKPTGWRDGNVAAWHTWRTEAAIAYRALRAQILGEDG